MGLLCYIVGTVIGPMRSYLVVEYYMYQMPLPKMYALPYYIQENSLECVVDRDRVRDDRERILEGVEHAGNHTNKLRYDHKMRRTQTNNNNNYPHIIIYSKSFPPITSLLFFTKCCFGRF